MIDVPRILIAALVVCAISCSSSGGSPPIVSTCLSFQAAPAPAAPSVVLREAATGSSCSTLLLEVVATDVNGVNAAGFDLLFDPALVTYGGISTTGSILSSDGTSLEVLEDDDTSGVVVIGITRLAAAAIDITGTQLLGTVTLQRVGPAGMSTLLLANENLVGGGMSPMPIPNVNWAAGLVSAN